MSSDESSGTWNALASEDQAGAEGIVSPRVTAGRATNAASARVTFAKPPMPTRSPAP